MLLGNMGIISSMEGVDSFNVRLKSIIEKESMASFSRGCGIHPSTIRKYLKANCLPSIDKIAAIAKYSECSLSWLITGQDEENSPRNAEQFKTLSSEECEKWWKMILEALTPQQKEEFIYIFQQGGIKAVFKLEEIKTKYRA
ncbi:Uncharacterised protein [Providencia rettgeri]|nr:Uncharacterised protein [Providencia rettgeri]